MYAGTIGMRQLWARMQPACNYPLLPHHASLPHMPHPLPHPPSSQVLKTVGLTSPMGLDYSHVLRNHLLPVPEYCACSSAHAFQGEGAAGLGAAAATGTGDVATGANACCMMRHTLWTCAATSCLPSHCHRCSSAHPPTPNNAAPRPD